MAVCTSAEEFVDRLQWDIPRFVLYGLSQYEWLAEPMREELNRGFTFFAIGLNAWAEIPAKDRASVWHVGAITGEALTHAALKLRAEAWARAASRGLQKPAATAVRDRDEPTRVEAAPAQKAESRDEPKANGKGRKRGPKPMLEVALRVAEVVARVAPGGDLRSKLDEICEALDEAEVPSPATWRKNEKRKYRSWSDCFEPEIAVKAIEYRLELARQQKKAASETLS
jgi:hypothetical protein